MLAFDPAVHVPEDIIAPADAPGTLPDMTAAPCLAAALDEAARLDGVPRSQTLAVALGAAALACSGVYDVRGAPQRGPLPTSLFILAEGRSGEGKSQSFKRLMKALHAHAARGRDTYAAEAEAWEASARETKKAGVPLAQPRPRNPDLTLPGMVTIQQLYRELAERPVLGWCSPDAGQVMGGHAFQPEHAMSTASALASAFSVEAMGNSTVRNGSLIVPAQSYRLSVLFMMQPRPARDFYGRPELRSVGAAWRFLTFRVDPKEAHALRRAAADEARAGRLPSAATPACDAFANALQRLLGVAAGRTVDALPVIEMSPEAAELWWAFEGEIDPADREDDDPRSRAAEIAARLAGVLTALEDAALPLDLSKPQPLPVVSAPIMELAIALVRLSLCEEGALSGGADGIVYTLADKISKKLFASDVTNAVVNRKWLTRYRLQELVSGDGAAELRALVMNVLVECGWLTPGPVNSRTSEAQWVVNDAGIAAKRAAARALE